MLSRKENTQDKWKEVTEGIPLVIEALEQPGLPHVVGCMSTGTGSFAFQALLVILLAHQFRF